MRKLTTQVFFLNGKGDKMFISSGTVIEVNATGANVLLLSNKVVFVANADMYNDLHSCTQAYNKAQGTE